MRKSVSKNTSEGKTDWEALRNMKNEDIDLSDSPELMDAWFKRAKLHLPKDKERISIFLDKDVLKFFKKVGTGYQTRINAILRAYVEAFEEVKKKKAP